MESTIKFSFSKAFFAEKLCVSVTSVSFIVIRYRDEEDTFERPGIAVKGVNRWVFDIEAHQFFRQSANHYRIPAKVIKSEGRVIFSTNDSKVEYDLNSFYRCYSKIVAHSLLKDTQPQSMIPTIKRNKWKSRRCIIDITFGKLFWSRFLHVNQKDISYGIVMVKYFELDSPDIVCHIEKVPVLKIKGISKYYFSIQWRRFFNLEQVEEVTSDISCWSGGMIAEYSPAKVVHSRDAVTFLAPNGEKLIVYKVPVYRFYMTEVVNTLIFG